MSLRGGRIKYTSTVPGDVAKRSSSDVHDPINACQVYNLKAFLSYCMCRNLKALIHMADSKPEFR
jgi:hypothetical protein